MAGRKNHASDNRPVEVSAPSSPVASRSNPVAVPTEANTSAYTGSVPGRVTDRWNDDSSNYVRYLTERRKFFERAFKLLREYVLETPPNLIDREFLDAVLAALEEDLPFNLTVSDVAAWSGEEVLNNICSFIEFSRQSIVPEPVAQRPTAPWEFLNDILKKPLVDVFAVLRAGGEEAVTLRDLFANEGYPLVSAAATTISQPIIESPVVVRKLWSDRSEDDPSTPSEFIKKYYDQWLPHTLAQQDLYDLDFDLYSAYTGRTRRDRHPEERITFAPKKPRKDKLDDAELGRRQRGQSNASKAKARSRTVRTNGPRMT